MSTDSLIERFKTQFSSFDPRLYQIASLSTLLLYGLIWLHFDVSIPQIVLTLAAALLTQYAGTRFYKLPSFDPRGPLISALSLCLLLRTNDLYVGALASLIAIGNKFVIRWKSKHIFNPTNLALVVILASSLGWISPGQWGQIAWLGFLIACMGSLVVTRAARADVTLSFLMISDPKTTPDSRAGRIFFALLVAVAALSVQFVLFRPNGPLWGLIVCSPLVPLLDRLFPGSRYDWSRPSVGHSSTSLAVPIPSFSKEALMTRQLVPALMFVTSLLLWSGPASAFCGFYVGKADTKLFNKASEVAIVRHDDKTVITMANDFKGDVKEFALVVPVPTVLEKDQIHVGDPAVLKHLADYSAPRLVEYFDANPCLKYELFERKSDALQSMAPAAGGKLDREKALGVTVEAQYTVGEYDILILS